MSNSERQTTSGETQERARWLKPNDWPLFTKIALGTVAVVALALIVTTHVNVRALQIELREKIGQEFKTQAIANASYLSDTLSEQFIILRSIALTDRIREDAATANARYSGDQESIEAQLLVIDEQWRAASDDSQLVQSIVNPQINQLAAQLFNYTKTFPGHGEILLTDRYGGLLASTNHTSDYYQADEEWWQAAYSNGWGSFYIAQPEYYESAGYTALEMAVPIFSQGGQVVGVVRTIFRIDAIYQLAAKMEFGETGAVTLVDSDGIVIADSNRERVGEQMPSSWRAPEMLEETSFWSEGVDDAGVPVLLAGAMMEPDDVALAIYLLDWVLFVHQTQQEAYAPVASATRTSLLATGAFALIAAGLAFVIARGLVIPIINLTNVARRMEAGDLDARARMQRRDEIGELARSFDSMADEVVRMMGILEQRVVELDRRAMQLMTAAEVSHAASSILDPDELLSQTVGLVANRFRFYYVGLFLVDEIGRWAVLRAGSGEAGRQMLAQGHRLEVGGDSMIGWCTANAQARIALDVGVEAVRFDNPLLPDTHSEIALPLISRGRVIGALSAQSTDEVAFTDEDIVVLQAMADQLVNAIENARLFQQAQESLEATRRAYGELSRETWGELFRARPDLSRRYDPRGILPDDGRWREEMKQAVRRGEIAPGEDDPSALAVPLKVRGQVIGVLDARKPAGEWAAGEIALLETLAEQLGVALESARLYQDTQRRAAHDRLTGEVTARMRETLDVDTVLQTAVREMREKLNLAEAEVRMGTIETVQA